MTNSERFNAALNSCQNPQAVYMALLAFADTDGGSRGMTNEELKAALISAIMELTEAEAAELLQQWKEARA